MVETRIEADVVYEHQKYGDVLVFFYDDYDGYGGMNPMPHSLPVDEFAKSAERQRVHEYVDTSSLREE